MTRPDKAEALHNQGYNCAQSVFAAFASEFFNDESDALKIASSFGAGVSYRGEMCGAVSGALMVIGLNHGYSDASSEDIKDRNYMISKEFIARFEQQHGSITCNKLIKGTVNTPDGLEHARQNDLFVNCPLFVRGAASILEVLFSKYSENKGR